MNERTTEKTNRRFRELEQLIERRIPGTLDLLAKQEKTVQAVAETFMDNDEDLKVLGALAAVSARYGSWVFLYPSPEIITVSLKPAQTEK